jgi:CRP-like cAMP-binding protein
VCGENLLKIKSRSSSILADEDSTVISIPLKTLWSCLKEHPETIITSKSILKILTKIPPTNGRTNGDAIYLSGWMKQLRFFSQLPPNVLLLCAKHCYLKSYTNGMIIGEHHEASSLKNIHVIIKGNIDVRLVKNKNTQKIKKLKATVNIIQKKNVFHKKRLVTRKHKSKLNALDHQQPVETSSEDEFDEFSSNDSLSSSSCSSYDTSSSSEDEEMKDGFINNVDSDYSTLSEELDRSIGPILTTLSSGDSFGPTTIDDIIQNDHIAIVSNTSSVQLKSTSSSESFKFGKNVEIIKLNHQIFDQAVKKYSETLVFSPNTCLNILKMDPQMRSSDQINLLVDFIKRGNLSYFFKQLPNSALQEIASVVRFKRIKENYSLYHKGQPTRLCYIVMTGSFSIYPTIKVDEFYHSKNNDTETSPTNTTNTNIDTSNTQMNQISRKLSTPRVRLNMLTSSSSRPTNTFTRRSTSRSTFSTPRRKTPTKRTSSLLYTMGRPSSSASKLNYLAASPRSTKLNNRAASMSMNWSDRCSLMKYWHSEIIDRVTPDENENDDENKRKRLRSISLTESINSNEEEQKAREQLKNEKEERQLIRQHKRNVKRSVLLQYKSRYIDRQAFHESKMKRLCGDVIGHDDLLNDEANRTATVMADEPSEVLVIPSKKEKELLKYFFF